MPTALVMVWLAGCAAAPTTRSDVLASGEALTVDLGFPRILSTMPEQENLLDLGPVLVPEGNQERTRLVILLEAADELGADAFVFEKRELRDTYPIQRSRVRTWREGYAGETHNPRGDLYTGPAPRVTEVGYYRAVRLLDHTPERCVVDRPLLGQSVASVLTRADSFAEQLRLLSVLFADGVLSGRAFREQRAQCLGQLDAGENQIVLH